MKKPQPLVGAFFLDLANLLASNQFQPGLIDANRNIYVCYAWSLKGFTMLENVKVLLKNNKRGRYENPKRE